MQQHKPHLLRGLNARHIRFIALGSAIGTGLFYGSAAAIRLPVPPYCWPTAGGAAVFIVMRALGEMAVRSPVSGSFGSYARHYLGPGGFYHRLDLYLRNDHCLPGGRDRVRHLYGTLVSGCAALDMGTEHHLFIGSLNLCHVRVFGEMEFWLSLIKVAAIIAMIAAGAGVIFFGFGHSFPATGVENLWTHGGFAPAGFGGVIASLGIVMFAFGGIEIIGITAAEARDPEKVIPQAINTIPLRIILFYVCTLFILMAIFPGAASVSRAVRSY